MFLKVMTTIAHHLQASTRIKTGRRRKTKTEKKVAKIRTNIIIVAEAVVKIEKNINLAQALPIISHLLQTEKKIRNVIKIVIRISRKKKAIVQPMKKRKKNEKITKALAIKIRTAIVTTKAHRPHRKTNIPAVQANLVTPLHRLQKIRKIFKIPKLRRLLNRNHQPSNLMVMLKKIKLR